MTHRRASARPMLALLLGSLLALLLTCGRAGAESTRVDVPADMRERAELLTEEERDLFRKSDVSADQARSLLLEQGYSPEEVDMLLRFPPETPQLPRTVEPAEMPGEEETIVLPEEETDEEIGPIVLPGIQPFGYRLFAAGPSSFAPPTQIAVGPDYLLGPDDTVVINAWGSTELSYSLTINPEGYVVIPEMGLVYLSSFTLGQARAELRNLFEKFYPGINIHVTVGQLRTVRAYVVGEVFQPGAYTLSSLSTIFAALYHAGGPTRYGSLRKVRLIRKNRVLGEVDLYQYLLQGDRTNDLLLENEDTVFIPPVGSRVLVRGEVRRPAIYELLPGEGLEEVIEMAGRVLPTGYLKRVQIDRIVENEKRIVLDIDYAPLDSLENRPEVVLCDGDGIRVFPVLPGYANAIWISGAVKRPGRYELKPGMTLLGVLEVAEGLEGEAYLPRVEIERTEPSAQIRLLSPNLGDILRGHEPDLALAAKDRVRVYSVWEVEDRDEIRIEGEVRKPGQYPLAPNMTLKDLIFRAGGLKRSAYLLRAEVARPRQRSVGDQRKSDINLIQLTDVVSGGERGNPEYLLQAGDLVCIRRIPQWDTLQTVNIDGEVKFAGTYAIQGAEESLADIFERAGGLGEEAFLDAAVLERRDEGRVIVDFEEAVIKRNKHENLVLEDGDQIHVPRAPETVQVRGAVFQPASLKFKPGKTADYYVRKCGGYLDNADRGKVRITRANGEVVENRRLWFDPRVQQGNVIVVSYKEARGDVDWEEMAQIASMMAGLATTVYLLTEAFRK